MTTAMDSDGPSVNSSRWVCQTTEQHAASPLNSNDPGINASAWTRYDTQQLRVFAEALLLEYGLTPSQARCTSEVLLEGDLLGHSTHGLQLLAPYLRDIESGHIYSEGEPAVIADHQCALTGMAASCRRRAASGDHAGAQRGCPSVQRDAAAAVAGAYLARPAHLHSRERRCCLCSAARSQHRAMSPG
jgi:Malate/L-lactate dehydrogenase